MKKNKHLLFKNRTFYVLLFGVVSLTQHSIFYIGTGKKKMLAM